MGIFGFLKKNNVAPSQTARVTSSKSALEIVRECNDSISTEKRKQICQKIIDGYSMSNNQLDRLAVAIAHKFLGASHRKQALQYYEMYLANPARIPKWTELQWIIESWMIRSDAAKLYESEYEYEKAIALLEECINLDEKKVKIAGYSILRLRLFRHVS